MPDLEITATGNVTGAVTALEKVEKALADVTGEANKVPAAIAKVQTELAKTAVAAVKADSTIEKASRALGTNLKTGANQAANSMQNLGRIIQDAPFGIIGITNNINPLLESFQRLKAETGSTGSAIKALAAGLIGGGGLGLAVSIVSSLLTVFALNSQGASKATEEHKEKIDETKKAEDEFKKSLDAASSSVVGQAKDISDLRNILISTTQEIKEITLATVNQGLATFLFDKKNVAVQKQLTAEIEQQLKLRKQNNPLAGKDFIPDIISADKLKKSIAEAQVEIIGINKLSDGFAGIFKKLVDGRGKAEKDILTIAEVLEKLRLELSYLSAKELTFKTDEAKAKISEIEKAIETLVTKLNVDPESKLIKRLFGDINDLKLPELFKKIQDSARKERLTIPVFFDENQMGAALAEAARNILKNFKGGTAIGIQIPVEPKVNIDSDAGRQSLIKQLKEKGINTIERTLENGLKKTISIDIAIVPELIVALNDVEAQAEAVRQRIADMFSTLISDSISSVADGISDALTGGKDTVPRLFDNLMKGIGGQIKELGKYLVQIGVQKLAIDKAIKALGLNPAATIAVGFAAQILGQLLINSAQKKSNELGFATGVRDFQGGGIVTVGERGPERIFLPQHSTVQPNNEMMAYGGGRQAEELVARMSATELVILLRRGEAVMGRNN